MSNQNKKSIWTIENFSFALITIGILIAISTFFLFIIGEEFSTSSNPIKADKFAQYGDTVGGVVGSLWALAGVLLFYAAFRKQIEALEDQKEATQITQKAIKLQSQELRLQRTELAETREVFKEQSMTLKIQQFENTFFSMLGVYNQIISGMDIIVTKKFSTGKKSETKSMSIFNRDDTTREEFQHMQEIHSGKDFFKHLHYNIRDQITLHPRKRKDIFEYYYDEFDIDFEGYYSLMYQILIRIDNCPFDNKQEYLDILASQISSKERELITYFEKAERLDVELLALLKKYKIIGEE